LLAPVESGRQSSSERRGSISKAEGPPKNAKFITPKDLANLMAEATNVLSY
jgi:hypothetical protein